LRIKVIQRVDRAFTCSTPVHCTRPTLDTLLPQADVPRADRPRRR